MKKRDNRLKKNSGGFTLIELIVTVAIIAIFSGVILSFIGIGSNTYRSTSSNAKVQMETQEVVDRMEDLIIDANRSVYYANGTGAAMGSAISDDIDGEASTGNKTFIVCNEYKNNDGKTSRYICDVIDWNKEEQKVYYSQREYDAASSKDDSGVQNADSEEEESENTESGLAALSDEGFSDDSAAEDSGSDISATVRNQKQTINQSVLATGIVDFHADVSKVVSDKIVRFQLSTISGTKEIKTLHSVSLRNPIKVLAPDDAFKKADATDVGIKILNAPQTMKPGESVMLSWGLTGNGSIDQSSIEWKVTNGDGSFPTQDPTNGTLTAGNSGTITVIVTAVTDDGQLISSAPVTIEIIVVATETPIPTPAAKSLQLSTNNLLLGAGNTYDMTELITFAQIMYDGDTPVKEVDVNALDWSVNGGTYDSITDGKLTVTDVAGTADTGAFKITATDPSTKLSAEIDVRVARIDVTAPANTYQVDGDKAPLTYTYMEGGADETDTVKNNNQVKVTWSCSTNKTALSEGNKYTAEDLGSWTVTATVDLTARGGFGTLSSQSTFTVGAKVQEQNIMIANNANIIVANRKYECSYYNKNWGIYFPADFKGNSSYQITWNIVNKSSNDTRFENSNILLSSDENNRPQLIVGADEHSLTLSADMIVYKENTSNIAYKFHGVRNIPVITGVTITSPDTAELIKGETYSVHAEIDVWDQNNRTALENSDKYIKWTCLGGQNNGQWTVPADTADNSLRLKAEYRPLTDPKASEVFASDDTAISSYKDYAVKELTYTPRIVAEKTSLFPYETTQVYLEVMTEKGLYNAQYVNWSTDAAWETLKLNNSGNVYQENTYKDGKPIPVTVMANTNNAMNVTLTASFQINNKSYNIQQIITITSLRMMLRTSQTEMYHGMDDAEITANIYNAEDDKEVTQKYSIEWAVNPQDESYSLDKTEGHKVKLKVNKNPDSMKRVNVTATAKNNGAIVCSDSINITINNKETISKSYNCTKNKLQKLEFDDKYMNENIEEISTSYLTKSGSLVPCSSASVPTLSLQGTTPSDLKVQMNNSDNNFEDYKYICISVDLGKVLYNFYIYPVKYNVYDKSGKAFTYVPADQESIQKQSSGYKNDRSFLFIDAENVECELRLSIHKKTGIGSFAGYYGESSLGKWFMKRGDRYFKLTGDKWEELDNGTCDQTWKPVAYARYISSYWSLDKEAYVFLIDEQRVRNLNFWYKWK